MAPRSEAGETTSSACWLCKEVSHDTDELRRTCFSDRRRRKSARKHENEDQQDAMYYNSRRILYFVAKSIVTVFSMLDFDDLMQAIYLATS